MRLTQQIAVQWNTFAHALSPETLQVNFGDLVIWPHWCSCSNSWFSTLAKQITVTDTTTSVYTWADIVTDKLDKRLDRKCVCNLSKNVDNSTLNRIHWFVQFLEKFTARIFPRLHLQLSRKLTNPWIVFVQRPIRDLDKISATKYPQLNPNRWHFPG